MKQLALAFAVVIGLGLHATAQTASEALKNATKAFNAFKAADNMEKLIEAEGFAATVMGGLDQLDPVKETPKALLLVGDIYSRLATYPLPAIQAEHPDAGVKAYDAYSKLLDLQDMKAWQIKAAQTGLLSVAQTIINHGASLYEAKDYTGALAAFQKVLKIKKTLDDAKVESILVEADQYKNILQYSGVTALLAKDNAAAIEIFNTMLTNGMEDPLAYDGLWKANHDTNFEAALGWLQKGREKYPEDQSLLYSEINYFIEQGKMVELETRLKAAIAKDPNNKTLYSTLGNVYDKLYQDIQEELKNETDKVKIATLTETGENYFQNAAMYYKKAVELDAKYFDVWYGLGALNFNRAAKLVNKRNNLPLSAEKEYDALSKEATIYFKAAYENFVAAEKIDASDRSLVIAFKELYANTGKLDHSNFFKNRLVEIEGGATSLQPYDKHPGIDAIKL